MAISNYSDLLNAVSNWMARGDVAGEAADFISLGEARLNRELNPVEVDAALTGALGSRSIAAPVDMVEPIALFLSKAGGEVELAPRADGTFAYTDTNSEPSIWAIDGENIDFNCPLDQAYPFRLRYKQRFALSDSAVTNWLLTNHPDVYLAASLMWGGVFTQDGSYAANFKGLLDETIPSVRSAIAQKKRGVLMVDPALALVGHRRGVYL